MKKVLKVVKISVVLFSMSLVSQANADVLKLTDGSVIYGTVLKMVDGNIHLKTSFADEIRIPWQQVTELESNEAVPVHIQDGSVIVGTIKTVEPDRIEILRDDGATRIPVTPQNITAINPPPPPPPPMPEKIQWHGNITGSLSVTDGNSDNQAFGVTADLNRRAEVDRITLKGGYAYSENEKNTTRDDQFILGKYDYFFDKKFFAYLNSRLDRDVIRDLNLRTTGGAGAGYQFMEDQQLNVFGEAGLSYVNEDFQNDFDDEVYAAGRLAAHLGWWILPEKVQFTDDIEVLLGFEDIKDWFAINDSSVTWKWNTRWSLKGSIRYEYDNTPATNRKSWDTKYLLGIGFNF